MKVIGLFAGIGGLELGFQDAGFSTEMLCEIDKECRSVLGRQFPGVTLTDDIRALGELPSAEVVTAGFPCQSFSQAGLTRGLSSSPLLFSLLRLIKTARRLPKYVVLENVPNIVHLANGEALRYITRILESLGYTWAYRVVDTSSFGLPQRRARWLLVASMVGDAPTILLAQDGSPAAKVTPAAHGFYWTEGNTGLGWADDAVPPLKSGSTLGIPSPPAIWVVGQRSIVTPMIGDAERLQGFRSGWTAPENGKDAGAERRRWRMVGNAVSVPTARWVAERIAAGLEPSKPAGRPFRKSDPWPRAAWGSSGKRFAVKVSTYPLTTVGQPILDFLEEKPRLLSARATRGFRTRLEASSLRYPKAFLADLRHHEYSMGALDA